MKQKKNEPEPYLGEETTAYRKEQILKSRKYAEKKDLLSVLLSEFRDYTLSEVDNLVENYRKGKVK